MPPEATLRAKVIEIDQRLRPLYRPPEEPPFTDPLDELVLTILSQNTNDRNRDLAFRRLRERFPSWEAVRDAPLDAVIEAIRPAGLAQTKGPRLQEVLRRITEREGRLTLDFLRTMPLEEARAWLTSLRGVGPKTAAIVLLFSLGRPAFPVDTHIHRVSKRLGLIGPKTSREAAHKVLEAIVPPERYVPFHLELIAHGRHLCRARRPRCTACPLLDLCPWGQQQSEAAHDEETKSTD